MTTRRLHLGLFLLLSTCFTATVQAQQIDPERYARVKAGYILNFLRLTEWPERAFQDENSPIIVAIVGSDDMLPFLREVLRGERINDRRILLSVLDYPRPRPGEYDVEREVMEQFERTLRNAHLLYIARDHRIGARRILDIVKDEPVLTVSDVDRFAENGGMLGLGIRENRVGIDANIEQIRLGGVTVSSRLLRLARIVNESNDREQSG